jgi:glycosyltransferase involved in cell wall biosynthesis
MHANSRLAMPEIEHGRNALLGRTPDEIADLVANVAQNPSLREQISKGGYETFQAFYRPDVVVPKMLSLLQDLVSS